MQVGALKERFAGELRAALTPAGVKRLVGMGFSVCIENNLGLASGFFDEDYAAAGASLSASKEAVIGSSELLLGVRKPAPETVALLRPDSVSVSFLDVFNEQDLLQDLARAHISAISMEMIPRSTRAQRMDALSSQANLAGYATVILAALHLPKIFPMMMTPAGTIAPARVFIIGAGVAGLQAIATAKRLGARVEAFDTRPVVAEQVRSLGARFVEIDLGEVSQTEQGYAKALTEEQLARQREGMKKAIAMSDVVITTAQVFGRPAPRIVTEDMVQAMRPGSVIVDMAVETGGNVAGSKLNELVTVGGVKIIGQGNLPAEVASNASEMFSANVVNLVDEIWDAESSRLQLDADNEIVQGCLITHGGVVVHPALHA